MTDLKLTVGDSLAGLLADGTEDTPYVGATLRLTAAGVEIEIPYLPGYAAPQFTHVDEWFRTQRPPRNMVLYTRQGSVTLYGCRWSGHGIPSGSMIGTGRIAPAEILLYDREAELSDDLKVATCRSRLDGLNKWSRVSAVTQDSVWDEATSTKTLTITVQSPPAVTWRQGAATLRIRSDWLFGDTEDALDHRRPLSDNVVIESEWDEPREFHEHLAEQRKVAHLLAFLFGSSLSFRQHRVRDTTISGRTLSGTFVEHPFVELLSSRTAREAARSIPSLDQLGRPLLSLTQIGVHGLEAWSSSYEQWERFILPAVAVIGRQDRFIEDVVMSTSMALEAAGQLLGPRPGEEATKRGTAATLATYVYRCLELLSIGWGDHVHSQMGLARAIAKNYNRVKHADNGAFPDHVETLLIGSVNELVARLVAVTLTDSGASLLERYRDGTESWRIRQLFETYAMRIADDDGTWVSTTQDDSTE